MCSLPPLIEGKEGYTNNADGALCMVVVDPATRKLLIPCDCIYPTRAQQRAAIPSLCQLFLQGRCRQGTLCHQVHANVDTVVVLRGHVGNLPRCCSFHGDDDIAGVLNERSWLSKVVLYIPEVSFEGGYVPLSRIGYTVPISKMLNELDSDVVRALDSYGQSAHEGSAPPEGSPLIVLGAGDIPICRLHVKERCRFAEECSFLHLCKEIAAMNPQLPLGRRSRLKVTQKESICNVSEPHEQNMLNMAPLSPSTGLAEASQACPSSVRGFPLVQRGGTSGHSSLANSLYRNGENTSWMGPLRESSSLGQSCEMSTKESPNTPAAVSTLCSLSYSDIQQPKQRLDVRRKLSSRVLVSCDGPCRFEEAPGGAEESTPELRGGRPCKGCRGSSLLIRGTVSDSMAASSRDEGASNSSMSLSTSCRCFSAGKWRHDPYNLSWVRMGG
ncbi:hypothetical protein TraAM80_09762 [Trypanosoma rangeli]|uniref:C3H1-type domain-containing protein n=1 Tax=Trypanosoma rangeli TaxID=5698 RepID=A0A3R7R5S5_TRYRA|nr:uncharacterized protein TraAM80_09762 [Trypanosoma rangeli]RNE96496.1 hypothetical protein TraAM80_09762 [Trypanosoma rangeli]|eukprot:RNE96496.1 hypothetical protein TraAM80_09762 [Trypanosoma rangeli]